MGRIKRCKIESCPLFHKKEVPYAGNKCARIVAVGESPGHNEEVELRPFVGQAGDLIKRVVRESGLNWMALFLVNSSRCRIDKKDMTPKEITACLSNCRQYVEAALHQIKPVCIVLWGDYAMRQVLKKTGITKARGQWVWSEEFNCWAMPTFHPAYILRNPSMEQFLLGDMKQVADFARNGYKPLEVDEAVSYLEVTDLRDVINPGSQVSLDTEGQGLDWLDPNFVMISVSVSDKEGRAYNVVMYEECPIEEADFVIKWPRMAAKKKELTDVGVRKTPQFDRKVEGLKWLLEEESVKIVMMHGNFDLHAIGAFFRRLHETWTITGYAMDVQAAANVLNENLYKLASLKELQRMFTNYKHDYDREFVEQFDKSDMLAVPRESLTYYACADADVTRRVWVEIKRQLLGFPRMALYYALVVHPSLFRTLRSLEGNGAWIDKKALPITTKEVGDMVRRQMIECLKVTPREIKDRELHQKKGMKLTRTDFIRDILFAEKGFGLAVTKKTADGSPSIDKNVRKELGERRMSTKARKFLEHYEQWSELHTLWSRYLKGFAQHVKVDGRIHSSYSLATTVTGRVASSKPNMQNNPKRSNSAKYVRRLIAAPKGWLLLAVDESQAELRWAAHVSNSKSMIRVFANGEDIHTNTAASMVRNWNQIDQAAKDKARRNAKPVNFGMLFLMSPPGLVSYAKYEYGVSMSVEEAQEYIDIWFRTYPEVRKYHESTIEFCRKNQYVESPLGRRRRLPEINSGDKWQRMEAERQAVNHPIQSPSSDIVLMACNELDRKEVLNPEDILPVLFVHDELVFQIRADADINYYAMAIKHEMENPKLSEMGVSLRVPLVSDVKIGPNLAQMEAFKL